MKNTPNEIKIILKVIAGNCDLRFQNKSAVPGTIEIANLKEGGEEILNASEVNYAHPFHGVKANNNCMVKLSFEPNLVILFSTQIKVHPNSLIGYRIGFYNLPNFKDPKL